MSWVFALIKSNKTEPIENEYLNMHDKPLFKIDTSNFYLALGGIEDTCLYEQEDDTQRGWAVVGLGIHASGSETKLLNKLDWSNLFSSKPDLLKELDGHFIAIRWNEDKIEFFSDQLGLRTAYFSKFHLGFCFSTQLDWVSKVTQKNELDLPAFGTRWLLFNQLGYESCIKGIERIGPGGYLLIKDGEIISSIKQPWLPEFGQEKNTAEAKNILEAMVNIPNIKSKTISLGLSGGLDSRTLLSILMANKKNNFVTHTFGEEEDPDVFISKKIVSSFGIQSQYFNDPMPESETLLALIKSFSAQNFLVEPCSSILRLRYYSFQHEKKQLIIDGGNGEIARRQFLNRVVKMGGGVLRQMNIPEIFKLFRATKADIFNDEFDKKIEYSAQETLAETLNIMPSLSEIGIGNFADLYSVRYRVPNYSGPEQTRSDGYVVNYMPLSQPSFLKAIFKLDISQRKNGKLYREIIQTNLKELEEFPLVKSGTTYPFYLNTVGAWLFTKVKNKIKIPYSDLTQIFFLRSLKDFILDIVHSNEVKNYDYYDYKKIQTNVNAFYKGEIKFANFIVWWLTFELWRRSLFNQ